MGLLHKRQCPATPDGYVGHVPRLERAECLTDLRDDTSFLARAGRAEVSDEHVSLGVSMQPVGSNNDDHAGCRHISRTDVDRQDKGRPVQVGAASYRPVLEVYTYTAEGVHDLVNAVRRTAKPENWRAGSRLASITATATACRNDDDDREAEQHEAESAGHPKVSGGPKWPPSGPSRCRSSASQSKSGCAGALPHSRDSSTERSDDSGLVNTNSPTASEGRPLSFLPLLAASVLATTAGFTFSSFVMAQLQGAFALTRDDAKLLDVLVLAPLASLPVLVLVLRRSDFAVSTAIATVSLLVGHVIAYVVRSYIDGILSGNTYPSEDERSAVIAYGYLGWLVGRLERPCSSYRWSGCGEGIPTAGGRVQHQG